MKDAVPCTLRCVHPPGNGRVALAFNKDGSDEVFRLTTPEEQTNLLAEMLQQTKQEKPPPMMVICGSTQAIQQLQEHRLTPRACFSIPTQTQTPIPTPEYKPEPSGLSRFTLITENTMSEHAQSLPSSLDEIDLQMFEAKEQLLRDKAAKAIRHDEIALLNAHADDFKSKRQKLELRMKAKPAKNSWLIEQDENNLKLTRLMDGKAIETYPPVHRSMAGVYVQAIVQGFRPPRELMPLDPPMVDDDDQD